MKIWRSYLCPWLGLLLSLLALSAGQCPDTILQTCECLVKDNSIVNVYCSNLEKKNSLPSLGSTDNPIQEVRIYNSTVTYIQDRAFDGLQVRSLVLRLLALQDLHRDAFLGLEDDLEEIIIDQNALVQLPNGVFRTLTNLQSLKLTHNAIRTLQPGLFKELNNLSILDLSGNQISTVSETSFEGLNSLSSISLNKNNLKRISTNLLSKLSSVTELHFRENQITSIASNALNRLSNVKKLYLSHNRLKDFDHAVFEPCRGLTHLDLSHNNISHLALRLLDSNNQLLHLDLSHNSLSYIPPPIFVSLSNLEGLYLNHNKLTSMAPQSFEYLNKLRTLHLQNNQLRRLNIGSLDGMDSLRELFLQENFIYHIDDGIFDRLDSLLTLNMSSNAISSMSYSPFSNQRDMLYVDLSRNLISTVEVDLFKNSRLVKKLFLNDNLIRKIEAGSLDKLQQLDELRLENNQLTAINESYFNMITLQRLYLSNNPISHMIQFAFYGTVNLQELHLSHGCLTELPGTVFKDLKNLKGLYLQHNPITSLYENSLDGLDEVFEVDLSFCDLSTIEPRATRFLRKAKRINLAYNTIRSEDVSTIVSGPIDIEYLDLSYNNLTDLDGEDFVKLDMLREIRLAGNPIHCNCSTQWLRGFEPFVDFENAVCASPDTDQGYLAVCSPVPFHCDRVAETPDVYNRCIVNLKDDPSTDNEIVLTTEQKFPVCYYVEEVPTTAAPEVTTTATPSSGNMSSSYVNALVEALNNTIKVRWIVLKNDTDVSGFVVTVTKQDYRMHKYIFTEFLVMTGNETYEYVINNMDFDTSYEVCIQVLKWNNTFTNHTVCIAVRTEEAIVMPVPKKPFPLIPVAAGASAGFLLIVMIVIYLVGRQYTKSVGENPMEGIGKTTTIHGTEEKVVDEITMSWDTLPSDTLKKNKH